MDSADYIGIGNGFYRRVFGSGRGIGGLMGSGRGSADYYCRIGVGFDGLKKSDRKWVPWRVMIGSVLWSRRVNRIGHGFDGFAGSVLNYSGG